MNKILAPKGIFILLFAIIVLVNFFSGYSSYVEFKERTEPILSISSEFSNKMLKDKFWEECGFSVWSTIIGLSVLLCYYVIKLYNKLASKNKEIQKDFANIDIFLKHRFDLIPNLVTVVKENCNYQQKVLEQMIKIREKYINSNAIIEKEFLNKEYDNIIFTLENYPELKVCESFLNLQEQLVKEESKLQAARRTYNIDVTEYNILLNKFPNNIIGRVLGFRDQKLLELKVD